MFTPKLNKSRSRLSTLGDYSGGPRTRTSFTQQNKTFTPTGTKQTFNSSVLQTSRVYEECGQHRLEAYGQSLPILVTEVLALKDRHVEPSVKISPSGWAWLVCGRRLLVWMYRTVPGKTPPCLELSLPPSSLPHKADLVALLPHIGDSNTTSCLAASPDGVLRYWHNVAHEGSFVEIGSELKGEECAALSHLPHHGFILATTSSSLMLVIPGQDCLRSRVLRPPQGMLKGISRRMSSFIFGSVSSQTVGGQFHCMLSGEFLDEQFTALYVLSGPFLQKWAVSIEAERLLYQCNVEHFVKDCLGHEVWHRGAAHLPNLCTWLLDMVVTRDGVVILAAGFNPDVSKKLYYCIGVLHTEGQDSPGSFLSFTVVQHTNHYTEDDEDRLLAYRLLIPNPANANAFLYEKKSILCTSVATNQHKVDKLEFYAGNDRILGAGHCDHSALFFSSSRGFVSIKSTTSSIETSINESLMEPVSKVDSSAVATPGKLEELSMSEEATSRLKAAFLHSCRGNMGQAQVLVDELFPPGMPRGGEVGSKLDRLVVQLSEEIIDDYPASDPRWAESHHSAVGSSVSLILIHQLEDKLKAHEYLVQFLKNVGLWDQFQSMPIRNTIMLTNLLLCEHAEKLVAAKTLRDLHTQHQALVDKAIDDVLDKRRAQVPGSGLTSADIFYREVSKIHEILEALVEIEDQSMAGDPSPRETVTMISSVNSIIGAMLTDSVQYRQSKIEAFQATSQMHPKQQEYLPWSASDEVEPTCKGARTLLGRQHDLTASKAIPEAQDAQERGGLFQQLLELTGLILDGYKAQLDTIKLTSDRPTQQYTTLRHKYDQERTRLIAPFVKHKQFERASALAEKYQDFQTLVEVCEATDSQDRLHRYMNQYQAAGFADFVFKWYLDEGKRGKLMTSSIASHPQLGRFLQTGENKFMSWLQDIGSNNFLSAHKTLFELGVDEKNSAAKKRTLLSLSKLAALATEDPPDLVHNNLDAITEEQDLLLHQEQLPAEVLENIGYDTETMKVFSTKELIELYVGDLNTNADEYDFLKALDLMSFIGQNDPDYQSLINFIWSKAVLRDNWSHITGADHLENCQDTVFYKTVELAHGSGYNLQENLPSAMTLLGCPQLAHMKDDANFQFLIKASLEQIHRVLNVS